MEINGINSHKFIPESKTTAAKDKTLPSLPERAESGSLDITGAYGRAAFEMRNTEKKYDGNNMSDGDFRRLSRSLTNAAEEISDDLYEVIDNFSFSKGNIRLVETIIKDEKLNGNKTLIDNLENFAVDITNPYQDALANIILSGEELLNNPDFMKNSGELISSVNNEHQNDFALKIISDKRLYSNKNLLGNIKYIFSDIKRKEDLDIKNRITDDILSDENLYNNKNIKENLGTIIAGVKNQNCYNIANKILSDKNLYENDYVANSLYYIIEKSNTDAKENLTEKLLSDSDLYSKKHIMTRYNMMLSAINSERQAEIADRLISTPEIYSSEPNDFDNLTTLVSASNSQNGYILSKKILTDENLYKNENVLNYAGDLVSNAKSDYAFKTADKILSNENLYGEKGLMSVSGIISSAVADNGYHYMTADKILSDPNLYKNENVLNNIYNIINSADAEFEEKTADKILSDEKFYNDKDFMSKVSNVISPVKTEEKLLVAEKLLDNEDLRTDANFMTYYPQIIESVNDRKSAAEAIKNLEYVQAGKINRSQYFSIYDKNVNITGEQFAKLNEKIGASKTEGFSNNDNAVAVKYLDFCGKKGINELTKTQKKEFVKALVSSDNELFSVSDELKTAFPILPKTKGDYKHTLKSAVEGATVNVKPLTQAQNNTFIENINSLSSSLAGLSDEEFNSLHFTQEYGNKEFISDVYDAVSELPQEERLKVFDFFGFELYYNDAAEYTDKNGFGFSLSGYPFNPDSTEKLSEISSEETKAVIEKVRPCVVKYTENNPVTCENKEIEKEINEILGVLPELRPTIGREQHISQAYDVFKHSLKVMKKISSDPGFETLNEPDKKTILLASLLHDITKTEGMVDRKHAENSGFDAISIAKKFGLTKSEEAKLYTIIKNHEWLGHVNTSRDKATAEKRAERYAYVFADGNTFDMALMFTHADLKSVRSDDSFRDMKGGRGRTDFEGNPRSFGESADYYGAQIKEKIAEMQKMQPLFPVTEFPKSDTIEKAITSVNDDGTTDLKGVYKDKDGLIFIKFNEVEDWEKIGFPKGTISKGIVTKTEREEPVDTGNIHFFVHALDNDVQAAKFDAFSLPDSDALLSLSYAERPESKYGFFRPQGLLLDCAASNVHGGGGPNNMGTGVKKNDSDFITDYFANGTSKADRDWAARQIKGSLGMSNEEYVQFVKENSNKPFSEIMPEEVRNKIIKTFSSMNSNPVCGNRAYNEIFASCVRPPTAVFSSSTGGERIGNPVEYFNSDTVNFNFGFSSTPQLSPKNRTEFLREYALENNLPFVVFGE